MGYTLHIVEEFVILCQIYVKFMFFSITLRDVSVFFCFAPCVVDMVLVSGTIKQLYLLYLTQVKNCTFSIFLFLSNF